MAVVKVIVETETGESLRETAKLYVLDRLLSRALEEPTYGCLRFIDPYGDTVFNRLQLPALLREWDHLARLASNESEREAMRAVQELAEYCLDEPHRYLRFYGD